MPFCDSIGTNPSGTVATIPVLARRSGFLISGASETYVADYETEVAKDSALADPVVRAAFDGTQIVVAVVPRGEQVLVRLELAESSVSKMRKRESSSDIVGATWSPDVELTRYSRNILLRPGHAQVLGNGANRKLEDGKRYRTRLVLEVTER